MKKMVAYCLLAAACAWGPQAHAACTLQTPMVSLGSYDALNPEPPPVLVSVQVTCTESTAVSVTVGKGSSNTYEKRTLRMGMESVDYNVYTGTNQANVWGDGTFGSLPIQAMVNANEATQFTGNASIYPGQSPLPGLYTDILIFTATF